MERFRNIQSKIGLKGKYNERLYNNLEFFEEKNPNVKIVYYNFLLLLVAINDTYTM